MSPTSYYTYCRNNVEKLEQSPEKKSFIDCLFKTINSYVLDSHEISSESFLKMIDEIEWLYDSKTDYTKLTLTSGDKKVDTTNSLIRCLDFKTCSETMMVYETILKLLFGSYETVDNICKYILNQKPGVNHD